MPDVLYQSIVWLILAFRADLINRWARCGNLLAAVSQDWMCEPFIVQRTGLSVSEHQRRTIQRYDDLLPLVDETYVLPVLQGYRPIEYVQHISQYGRRLAHGAWVGVGSVCKRNKSPKAIVAVIHAIKKERPDLRLHGFGVKKTALEMSYIRQNFYSADSMAWSTADRWRGDDVHDWKHAANYAADIESQTVKPCQIPLF